MKLLFLTWDSGQTSYLPSLFFPILARLRDVGVEAHVLQYTWADAEQIARTREAAQGFGLRYTARRIPAKVRKAATPAAIPAGAVDTVAYCRRHGIDTVMPRAIIPSAMALAAARMMPGLRIVWDADGLPADERVDFVGWSPGSVRTRALRAVEREMLLQADRIMVRTRRAAEILHARAGAGWDASRVHVIPNAKDEDLFAPDAAARQRLRSQLGVGAGDLVAVSVGQQTEQYLPDSQARLVAAMIARSESTRAVFLTAQSEVITDALARAGAPAESVVVRRVPADEVPHWLSAADVGIALRDASFSQRAVCPIKIGEYLLCGLPVISTRGIGDMDEVLDRGVGFTIEDTGDVSLDAAAQWAIESRGAAIRTRARKVGLEEFSLRACVARYGRLLN